jgi:hypothetical protein
MSGFIEDKELLTIGNITIDVSNVPYYKKRISRRVWDGAVKDMGNDKEYDLIIFDDIVDTYGLYMLRQDFAVLKRRMSFIKACWSYVKRSFLSIRYIRKTNETEYNKFQEWAFFNITGTKKKDLKAINQIQKMELLMIEEMEKLNLSQDQLTALLQTFLQETAGNMNISVPLRKA